MGSLPCLLWDSVTGRAVMPITFVGDDADVALQRWVQALLAM